MMGAILTCAVCSGAGAHECGPLRPDPLIPAERVNVIHCALCASRYVHSAIGGRIYVVLQRTPA